MSYQKPHKNRGLARVCAGIESLSYEVIMIRIENIVYGSIETQERYIDNYVVFLTLSLVQDYFIYIYVFYLLVCSPWEFGIVVYRYILEMSTSSERRLFC